MAWTEISKQDLPHWNERLLQSDIHLYQYPYWNEAYRAMHFSPRYLAYRSDAEPQAYVCVLSLGIPGLRIGLVRRGPATLLPGQPVSESATGELVQWAKRHGYVFLRFTHSGHHFLAQLAEHGKILKTEPFPFHRDLAGELVVEQEDSDDQMKTRFAPVMRSWIERASKVGYEIKVDDSPDLLAETWPLFVALAEREAFRYRPLASWQELIHLARAHDAVRVYAAYLNGAPVEALLVVRDGVYAYPILGALQVASVRGKANPSYLLHWLAMRGCYRSWRTAYNLNSPSPISFKRQFNPREIKIAEPTVLVLNRVAFRLWQASLRFSPTPRWLKRLIFR